VVIWLVINLIIDIKCLAAPRFHVALNDKDYAVCCMLELVQEEEFNYYYNQLWTAPELLRMTTQPINGTQKADIYSFAIILQEIIFKAQPYFIGIESPKGKPLLGTTGM